MNDNWNADVWGVRLEFDPSGRGTLSWHERMPPAARRRIEGHEVTADTLDFPAFTPAPVWIERRRPLVAEELRRVLESSDDLPAIADLFRPGPDGWLPPFGWFAPLDGYRGTAHNPGAEVPTPQGDQPVTDTPSRKTPSDTGSEAYPAPVPGSGVTRVAEHRKPDTGSEAYPDPAPGSGVTHLAEGGTPDTGSDTYPTKKA